MGYLTIKNLFGGDLIITSTCNICNKEHTYRVKERKTCSDDKCYQESKKRSEKRYVR